MYPSRIDDDDTGARLAWHALLYTTGALDGAEAGAFEKVLAENQRAREALGQAAQLVHRCTVGGLLLPQPGYRTKLRQRLLPRRGLFQRLTGNTASRGRLLAGAGLGIACVLLLLLGLSWLITARTTASSSLGASEQTAVAQAQTARHRAAGHADDAHVRSDLPHAQPSRRSVTNDSCRRPRCDRFRPVTHVCDGRGHLSKGPVCRY
jgi:hypothetical protein